MRTFEELPTELYFEIASKVDDGGITALMITLICKNIQNTCLKLNKISGEILLTETLKYNYLHISEWAMINGYPLNLCDFLYGRFYQLVVDRSKFNTGPGRKYHVKSYMESKTKDEIIIEALEIVNKHLNPDNRKPKLTTCWCIFNQRVLESSTKDGFYTGRCIQFILDSNAKRSYMDIISDGKSIIGEAHVLKTFQLYPKKGTVYDTYKHCGYEDDCEWTYGEKRCSCGNRRFELEVYDVESIDDTDLYSFATPY